MKAWGRQIILVATLTLLTASASVLAQEAGMSDVEINDRAGSHTEAAVFTPGEDLRYVPRTSSVVSSGQDSIALQINDFPMQRAAQKASDKTADKQNAKKDDSILTFNFLYYIIQKYKLQDIID